LALPELPEVGPRRDAQGVLRVQGEVSATLLLFVGCIYVVVATGYCANGRYGMAVAFIAYAVANIGFALDAL
jgi:hypothetical protein